MLPVNPALNKALVRIFPVEDDSQKKQAMIVALRTLTASPKSRMEITQKLKEKGFPSEVISETLGGLEKSGFLNDKSYAQNLTLKYTQGKPSGSRKIQFELKRHGISGKVREVILSGINPEDEKQRALEVASARWERLHNLDIQKRKKRVFDLLLRRGFDFSIVREVIENLHTGTKNAED